MGPEPSVLPIDYLLYRFMALLFVFLPHTSFHLSSNNCHISLMEICSEQTTAHYSHNSHLPPSYASNHRIVPDAKQELQRWKRKKKMLDQDQETQKQKTNTGCNLRTIQGSTVSSSSNNSLKKCWELSTFSNFTHFSSGRNNRPGNVRGTRETTDSVLVFKEAAD